MFPTRAGDAMQPLVFALLRSLTPPEVETELWDERVGKIPYDRPVDLVAITVETFTARSSYRIAARFRARGIPVVMGGYHPSLLPEEALEHADAVVIGDADELWPELVADAARGAMQRIYRSASQPAPYAPAPDRSLFSGEHRYAGLVPLQYGRGCPKVCDFCSINAMYGRSLRFRPLEAVIDEVQQIEQRNLFFVDDNLFADLGQLEQLCRALLPLRRRWVCQAGIEITRDEELLSLMARSGCQMVFIGFESLNPANLRQMGKRAPGNHADYSAAIKRLRSHSIMITGSFIFGYDHDGPEAFEETLAFARREKFFLAHFNPLTPTPGTRLYQRLQEEGRLRYDRWWLDPEYRYGQAIFNPRGMTAAQLEGGCYDCRRRFNTHGAILHRAADRFGPNSGSPFRLSLFFSANYISRREIERKQWSPLGSGPDEDVETAARP